MGKGGSSGPEQRKRDVHTGGSPGQVSKPSQWRYAFLTGDWPAKQGEKGSHSWQGGGLKRGVGLRWIRKTFLQDG